MSHSGKFAVVVLALTAILAGQLLAEEEWHAYPFQYTYATGRIDYHQVQGWYEKYSAEMKCGRDGQHLLNPWMKLDLSGIPPNAVVDEAYLYYYVNVINGQRPENYVTVLENDPVPASAEVIYNDIKNGMIVGNDVPHGTGWVERLLDSQGRQAIMAAIEQGWIAFGLYAYNNPSGRMNCGGYNEGPQQPHLKFRYHIPPPYDPDLAVTAINSPVGQLNFGATVFPEVVVSNLGTENFPYTVTLMVVNPWTDIFYADTIERSGLAPGDEAVLTFKEMELVPDEPNGRYVPLGTWTVVARVTSQDDIDPENDAMTGWFQVIPPGQEPVPPKYGWEEVRQVPQAPSYRFVRRGGWLALNRSNGLVYGAKGDRTSDFYSYNPATDRWTELARFPFETHPLWGSRAPQDGARGVSDHRGSLYVLQGNRTLGFWRYDIEQDRWHILPDVPNPSGRGQGRIGGGTSMAYVRIGGLGYVYVLKGGRTGEFWRYNVNTAFWEELPPAPEGVRGRWDRGTWLLSDGLGTLYAHKARYLQNVPEPYHELWLFDVRAGRWEFCPRRGLPLVGWHVGRMRGRPARDGGGAGWFDGNIWALKGGNSQQYFRYEPGRNRWYEEEPIGEFGSTNRRRMVRHGGDFVAYPQSRAFYALKGNKTVEFWRYRLPPEETDSDGGGQTAADRPMAGRLAVRPNPVTRGQATLNYALPVAGPAGIHVHDVSGRRVLSRELPATRNGSVSLDLRSLSAGVYLVRLEADGFTASEKLVIAR